MYQINEFSDMPLRMIKDLSSAATAERAEQVFHWWRDHGVFTNASQRADFYSEARLAYFQSPEEGKQ